MWRRVSGSGPEVPQPLDVVDLGEALEVLQLHVLEGVGRLVAQRGAVDHEEHAAEPLGLDAAGRSGRWQVRVLPVPVAIATQHLAAARRRVRPRRPGRRPPGSRAAGRKSGLSASSLASAAVVVQLEQVAGGPSGVYQPSSGRGGWSACRPSRTRCRSWSRSAGGTAGRWWRSRNGSLVLTPRAARHGSSSRGSLIVRGCSAWPARPRRHVLVRLSWPRRRPAASSPTNRT